MKKLCITLCIVFIAVLVIIRFVDFTDVIAVDTTQAKQTCVELHIAKNDYISNQPVTRLEFAISLLKCIGATEATNEHYIESEPSAPPYNDLDECMDDRGYIYALDDVMRIRESLKRSPYEITVSDNDKPFSPHENILVKDAVTFILNCTRNSGDSYFDGIRLGVISKKDTCFSLFGNKTLTYDDMYVLLYRVLMQPRYQYLDYVPISDGVFAKPPWWKAYADDIQDITYIEYLKSKQ